MFRTCRISSWPPGQRGDHARIQARTHFRSPGTSRLGDGRRRRRRAAGRIRSGSRGSSASRRRDRSPGTRRFLDGRHFRAAHAPGPDSVAAMVQQPVHHVMSSPSPRRRLGRRAPLALIEPVSSTADGDWQPAPRGGRRGHPPRAGSSGRRPDGRVRPPVTRQRAGIGTPAGAMAASARSAAFGGAWPPPAAGEAVSAPLCAVSGLAAGAAAPSNRSSCVMLPHPSRGTRSSRRTLRSAAPGTAGEYPSFNADPVSAIAAARLRDRHRGEHQRLPLRVALSTRRARRHRHSRTAPLTGTGVGEARGAHRATRCLIAHVPPRGGHAPCACGSGSVAPKLRPSAGAVPSTTNSPCPTIAQRGAPRASHLRVTRTW